MNLMTEGIQLCAILILLGMRETLFAGLKKEVELLFIQMAQNTKVNGKLVFDLDKELTLTLMETGMKEHGQRIGKTDTACIIMN